MPNANGRFTKEEVQATGLPVYIPRSKSWTHTPYPFAVLISKTRCGKFGVPILRNGAELPSAFLYQANAGAGTGDLLHRYTPLYDRTDVFVREIGLEQLLEREIMRGESPH
ncbi:hypothetical protein [Paenibacillus sp. YYML68]|uniref:hypothetical protein n=1 Tax=Paenibacillus sp. YYML68 TaxID=2909250 RepID=UPI002492DB1C|nr:hypothetical protein [Paenibacillus sp. YYML68]